MPPKFSRGLNEKIISGKQAKDQTRTSPCEAVCPAGMPIQKIHSLIEADNLKEAFAYLLARNPLAAVTGRICPHPCETQCNRRHLDEAVAIRALERHASDSTEISDVQWPQKKAASGKKVAVVGSGPAGMTSAYFLALLGHEVVIFEAEPVLGGIPRVLVPEFKLPRDIVDRQVGHILAMGVKARTNVRVGRDIAFDTIRKAFDACLICVGTSQDRQLVLPGAQQATPALTFLKQVSLGHKPTLGKRVVILGGGGVAFDCAFTAKRLGASQVDILCVEGEDCMCATPADIQQAGAENIAIHNSKLAVEIQNEKGLLTGVIYANINGFHFDDTCCLHIDGGGEEAQFMPADTVISAIGVCSDFSFLEQAGAFAYTPRRTLAVDGDTGATSVDGVFAAGDAALGPSSVAAAIGSGRSTAISIHHYLTGGAVDGKVIIDAQGKVVETPADIADEPHVVAYEEIFNIWYHNAVKRQQPEPMHAQPDDWYPGGTGGLAPEQARVEAERCLHCGHCTACGTCVEDCPGMILSLGDQGPRVVYPEECWHCGCCRIACPSGAVSYEFPLHMLV